MQTKSSRSLALALVGHLAMGAGLGAFLAVTLLLSDANDVFQMIVNSADPKGTILVFVGTLTMTFAIGATLTGLIFRLQDRQ